MQIFNTPANIYLQRTDKNIYEYSDGSVASVESIEILTQTDSKGRVKPAFLNTLNRFPKEVTGNMVLTGAPIKSLRGCPKAIGGSCGLNDTDITSMAYGPVSVGALSIDHTAVSSFAHFPNIDRALSAVGCKFTSLKGCPEGIQIDLSDNQITSLADCPSRTEILMLSGNQIKGFKELDRLECTWLNIEGNPIESFEGIERVHASKGIFVTISTHFKGSILYLKLAKSTVRHRDSENLIMSKAGEEAMDHLDKSLFRAKHAMVLCGAKKFARLS